MTRERLTSGPRSEYDDGEELGDNAGLQDRTDKEHKE